TGAGGTLMSRIMRGHRYDSAAATSAGASDGTQWPLAGTWRTSLAATPNVSAKRLGMYGSWSPHTTRDGTRPASARSAACQPANLFRSEEHTSELQSLTNLVCRLLLEKKT